MELKTLVLGILISMAWFAVKSGVGIHYFMASEKRMGRFKKLLFALAGVLMYTGLFASGFFIAGHMNTALWYDRAAVILKSGLTIHFVMAVVMGLWGTVLLKNRKKSKTRAWLIMVLPCPMCALVILFTMAALSAVFPQTALFAALMISGAFVLIQTIAIGLSAAAVRKYSIKPDVILGWIMLGIAAYFLISIMVIPQFRGIDRIFTIASAGNTVTHTNYAAEHLMLVIFISCAFAAGIKAFNSKRRYIKWLLGLC